MSDEFVFWIWVVVAAVLGLLTYVGKKMIEEIQGAESSASITRYLKSHKLELIVMGLSVAGAIMISALLKELTIYAAYMTGIAGGSISAPTTTGAKNIVNRFTGKAG